MNYFELYFGRDFGLAFVGIYTGYSLIGFPDLFYSFEIMIHFNLKSH